MSKKTHGIHEEASKKMQSTEDTMSKEIAVKNEVKTELSVIEQVVMQGDLSKLNPEQRVTYYRKVCDSAGLNPYTRPFDYINLNGKLTLYAKKDATEQLRKLNGISIERLECKVVDDLYIVTAVARTKDGRVDQATGAVTIGNLKGDAKANAIMKAETKAKRRVTLSISGMGWTDETELETIPGARPVNVDLATGELITEHKRVEEIPLKRITAEQANDLMIVLEQCPKEYIDSVNQFMKKQGWTEVSQMTPEIYERIFQRALDERTKLVETFKKEKEEMVEE